MSWRDRTWLDNPVWHCTCDKTVVSQHPGSQFPIISSVLCKDGSDNYEQLVHGGEFGCIKTAQVRRWIRWWHHISSDLGIHVCAEQFFQCGKKCVCRGIWRILLGAVDQYPEQWLELWLLLSLYDHHTSPCGNSQRNLEYYIWPCLTAGGTWWWSYFGQCL